MNPFGPAALSAQVKPQAVQNLFAPLRNNRYNTLYSALTVLALGSVVFLPAGCFFASLGLGGEPPPGPRAAGVEGELGGGVTLQHEDAARAQAGGRAREHGGAQGRREMHEDRDDEAGTCRQPNFADRDGVAGGGAAHGRLEALVGHGSTWLGYAPAPFVCLK